MNISALSGRSGRLIPVLSACAGAVLALGAAASPSAALAAPAAAHAVSGTSAAVSSGWGNAQEVPGIAALNKAGSAAVNSVSCPAAGNCGAVGVYTVSNGGYLHTRPFVVSEKQGTWSTGKQLPGAEVLSHRSLTIPSVSCASPGNCSTGGSYATSSTAMQAFVASRVNYTWGDANEVPGLAALNDLDVATVTSVSCASAGNCSAGGNYDGTGGTGGHQAFVVSQTNGTWGNAIEVPGTAALNMGGSASISSVSCASAGNCSAGGYYYDSSDRWQMFVVSETNGTWGNAIEVPGTAALNTDGWNPFALSVSCASAGNCTAGGSYGTGFNQQQAFVASQVNGTWGNAIEAPGTAALNVGMRGAITSVSCASAGNCAAGGYYDGSSGETQAFVIDQADGTWGNAIEVPGTAALNQGDATINAVSCGSAGNCSAGGSYYGTSGYQAFVVNEASGSWDQAIEVPGTAALNQGDAAVNSVSCATATSCSAGGSYTDRSGHAQAFVVTRTS